MTYTRKQLRQLTGLADKSLRWLLDRLDIQPADFNRTIFGSPICVYGDDVLSRLNTYIADRKLLKAERAKGKRCRGGCNRYLPPSQLNSQQICAHCRRRAWLTNEVCHRNPLFNLPDKEIISDLKNILKSLAKKK